MEVGDRILTNDNCDFPDQYGVIENMSKEKNFLLVKLDTGLKLLTCEYAVNAV